MFNEVRAEGAQALLTDLERPPPKKKRRQVKCDFFEFRPGRTLHSVRYGPLGREIVINVDMV